MLILNPRGWIVTCSFSHQKLYFFPLPNQFLSFFILTFATTTGTVLALWMVPMESLDQDGWKIAAASYGKTHRFASYAIFLWQQHFRFLLWCLFWNYVDFTWLIVDPFNCYFWHTTKNLKILDLHALMKFKSIGCPLRNYYTCCKSIK